MKKPKILKTAFSTYDIDKCIGQGGNGCVYKATENSSGKSVAIKVLDKERATQEKLKRFKNEYHFCSRKHHPNIILVQDYGLTDDDAPFFTMPLHEGSLRKFIGTLKEEKCFSIVRQILDGLEASHKLGVVHRDLKPENILYSDNNQNIVLTDFGIAEFGEEELFTAVETDDGTRLANFQYAAPEQRRRGGIVGKAADIYSLGLIINELFTGSLALGKNHKTIKSVSEKYGYLDIIVDKMLESEGINRYQNIEDIKQEISARSREYLSTLKVSELRGTVIPSSEIDDPIVSEPMEIKDVSWERGILTITLNHQVNSNWAWAFTNLGSHSAIPGKGPIYFKLQGNEATISTNDGKEAQRIVNFFKDWLPQVNRVYGDLLKQQNKEQEEKIRKGIEARLAEEEKTKVINANLSF